MKRREEMTFLERIYVVEVVKGISITIYRLVKNALVNLAKTFGVGKGLQGGVEINYPNERRVYPERYRGRHRLTIHDNGDVKCTACFLCATACPARCIYIEPEEHADSRVEKFPKRYEIDTLLCIYCGYCVEACPVDAIRMDTGLHPEIYAPNPVAFIEDKEILMERSRILDKFGPGKLYEMHMERMQEIESQPFKNGTPVA